MPTIAAQVRFGVVSSRWGRRADPAIVSPRRTRSTPMTTEAITKAAGTAQRAKKRTPTSHATTMGTTAAGWSTRLVTGARHSSTTTPASMAWAIGGGMRLISRPSIGHRPVRTYSRPARRNAPTAAAQPPSTVPVLARSAAPGVDHTSTRGRRYRRASHTIPTVWATHRTSSPDDAWAEVAPTARRPVRTTAKELV